MVSYVEPGMYLIAACLPFLRPLFLQPHRVVSSGISRISSFGQRRYASGDDVSGSPEGGHGGRMPESLKPVDVKLTGIGNVQSLIRAGDAIVMGSAVEV